MDFGLSEEQAMIVETTRAFVEAELYPHEQMVERSGVLPLELIREIQQKAMAAGLYAANMPVELGGRASIPCPGFSTKRNSDGRTTRCTGPAWRGRRTSSSPGMPSSANAT